MSSRTQGAIIALGIASVAGSAQAQVEPIRLTYNAPAECSSENEFLQQVTSRTARARRAVSNERARAFVVTIVFQEGKIHGQLEITGLDGAISTREMTGDTCGEVVSALALTTALSIDPLAAVTPASGPEGASPSQNGSASQDLPAPTAPQASSATGATQGADALPEDPSRLAHPSPKDRALAENSDSTAPASTERPRWDLGGGGQVVASLAPGLALGGELFGAVNAKASGLFAPSFRLSFESLAASAQFNQAFGADLTWFLARFEACALRFSASPELSASLCAAIQGGVLHSGGASPGLQQNHDVDKPWVAPEALVRLRWDLSARWFVGGAGGIAVPLIRYHFYYLEGGVPSADVYDFQLVGATLALDTGYRFP